MDLKYYNTRFHLSVIPGVINKVILKKTDLVLEIKQDYFKALKIIKGLDINSDVLK